MKKTVFVILLFSLFLSSCDFSALFNQDKPTIESFKITVSENEALSADITGIINGEKIYLVLPYTIFENSTSLRPTIKTNDAEISPGGAQCFNTPVIYTVQKGDYTKLYSVYASVDPNSVSYLKVSRPFYVDENGIEVPISDENYTYTLNNDTIELMVSPEEYLIIQNKRLGFTDLYYPWNATVSSSIVYGQYFPYTATVTSKDGMTKRDYTISVNHGTVTSTTIDVTATCYELYDVLHQNTANTSQYESFLNEKIGTAYGASTTVNFYNSHAPIGGFSSVTSLLTITFVQSTTTYNANIVYGNAINAFSAVTETYINYSADFQIPVLPVLTNTFTYTAPATSTATSVIGPFKYKIAGHLDIKSPAGSYSADVGPFTSNSFTFTSEETYSYTPRDYYKITNLCVTAQTFCTFENIYIIANCENYTLNNNTLTFNLIDTDEKITGVIAIFDVVSESGEIKTYFLRIS